MANQVSVRNDVDGGDGDGGGSRDDGGGTLESSRSTDDRIKLNRTQFFGSHVLSRVCVCERVPATLLHSILILSTAFFLVFRV